MAKPRVFRRVLIAKACSAKSKMLLLELLLYVQALAVSPTPASLHYDIINQKHVVFNIDYDQDIYAHDPTKGTLQLLSDPHFRSVEIVRCNSTMKKFYSISTELHSILP